MEQFLEFQQKFASLTVDDMENCKHEAEEFTAKESYLSYCTGCEKCATLSETEKRFMTQFCKS